MSLPETSNRLPRHTIPLNYNLLLTPIPSTRPEMGFETFEATVLIDVRVDEDTEYFVLNSQGLGIGKCTLQVGERTIVGAPHFVKGKAQLIIMWSEKVAAGSVGVLSIEYDGPITTDSMGIYQNSYQGGKRRGIGTQLEQCAARKVMPCWDEPAFKSTFEMSITVPSFYTVLFNSHLLEAVKVREGFTRHTFAKTPIMSTYLMALFVGEAECVSARSKSGCDVRIWAPVGEKDLLWYQLDFSLKCLDFFEDFYQMPFPMKKLDMVGLDSFVFGGMENFGLITYSASLFYISKEASLMQKAQSTYVIAHEIAHSWFGNIVTMEWWNDLWLNEGFATYAGWLAVKHICTDWDVDSIVFDMEFVRGLKADGFASTHAVEIDPTIDDVDKISLLVDSITYSKGFGCLAVAAQYCGKENFRAGVSAYIKKYAYKNAKTVDLLKCLSEASGKDVVDMVGKWTSYVGYPVVRVSRTGDTLFFSQERFLASGERVENGNKWPIPIKLFYGRGETEFFFSEASTSFSLPMSAAGAPFVLVDPGHSVFMRTIYSPGMWQDLLKHVSQLQLVDKIALLESRLALSSAGFVSSSEFLRLVLMLENDPNPRLIASLLGKLKEFSPVWRLARGGILQPLLDQLLAHIAAKALASIGETRKKDEPAALTDVRVECLQIRAKDASDPLHGKYLDMLSEWKQLSRPDLAVALSVAVASKSHGWDVIAKIFEEGTPHMDLVLRFLASCTETEKKVELIKKLPSGSIFRFWCSQNDFTFMWTFCKNNWELLHNALGGQGNPLSRMFEHVFSGQSDVLLLDDIAAFYAKLPVAQQKILTGAVDVVSETIKKNNAWIERDFESVQGVLLATLAPEQGQKPSGSRGRATSLPVDGSARAPGSIALSVAETVLTVGAIAAASYGIYYYFFKSGSDNGGH